MVRSMSLRLGTRQDDHRLGGWTTYRTDFTANQLVWLLGTHSYSAITLSPTSWLDCSSHGLHRQLCWGLASYAGDSSVFGFFYSTLTLPPTSWLVCSVLVSSPSTGRIVRCFIVSYAGCLPAKLGTPLMVGSCYVSSVCYQAAPCYSNQGADLG